MTDMITLDTNNYNLTLDQFLAYKYVNPDILPELEQYIDNSGNVRSKHKSKSQWRKDSKHTSTTNPTNWILVNKLNQSEDDKLYSKFRSILNKMSDSNLNDLSAELINMNIKTKYQLEKLVEFIFVKAIAETKFSEMYAKLSKALSTYYIYDTDTVDSDSDNSNPNSSADETRERIYFRAMLINRCQQMFNDSINFECHIDKEDVANSSDESVLDAQLQEDIINISKAEILGCMIYIGQLYNHELLTDKIVHSCFLLIFMKCPHKAYIIDILCTFIKTVGPRFFKRCPNDALNFIKKMELIRDDENINIKDKFAIMDVLDIIKKDKWLADL